MIEWISIVKEYFWQRIQIVLLLLSIEPSQRCAESLPTESTAVYCIGKNCNSVFFVWSLCLCPLQLWNSLQRSSAVQCHAIDRTSFEAHKSTIQRPSKPLQTVLTSVPLSVESMPVSSTAVESSSYAVHQAARSTAPPEPHSSQAGVGTSVLHRQGLCLQCNLSVESVPVSLQVWNPHRTL